LNVSSTPSSREISKKNKHRCSSYIFFHYRGEKDLGYSKPFRQLEFTSALEAELEMPPEKPVSIEFVNALNYTGQAAMDDVNIEHFNEAMQYISFPDVDDDILGEKTEITRDAIIRAVARCSLVHAVYEVIALAEDLNDLATMAIEDGGFEDLYKGGPNEHATWCFRARNYVSLSTSNTGKEKRYSARARSTTLEKAGLKALTELLIRFGGKVSLLEPDCKIYLFDGLEESQKLLARCIGVGPRVSENYSYCTRL
jgi:hypothetical protein